MKDVREEESMRRDLCASCRGSWSGLGRVEWCDSEMKRRERATIESEKKIVVVAYFEKLVKNIVSSHSKRNVEFQIGFHKSNESWPKKCSCANFHLI